MESGQDFRVVRTAGVEGEMELPYAALQQLCAPIIGLTERLPDPAARRARRRVRTQRRAGARSVPRRACRPRSVVGGGRGAPVPLRGRRRAVAGRCVGSRAGVRSRAGCSPRRSRSCSRPASEGDTLRGLARGSTSGRLGRRDARVAAGVRPAGSALTSRCSTASIVGDARQSARAPGAAARHDADAARRRVRRCPRRISLSARIEERLRADDSRALPPDGRRLLLSSPRQIRPGISRSSLARRSGSRSPESAAQTLRSRTACST